MKGSAYLEVICVTPLFLFIFLCVLYFGRGYFLSQLLSELSKTCLWYESRNHKKCEVDFKISNITPEFTGNFYVDEIVNMLSGAKGMEVSAEYSSPGFRRGELKGYNISELETWKGDTPMGKTVGYGAILAGFIKGFSDGSGLVENLAGNFLPEGFDRSRAEKVIRGIQK